MNVLYVTDLDGTLLNKNDRLSEFAIKTLNELIAQGMCFSYATARSLSTASIVTKGLRPNLPVIIYNGTFIVNPNTKERLAVLCFDEHQKNIMINFLNSSSTSPLIYGFVNKEEKVSWLSGKESDGIKRYLNFRKGDLRLRPIKTRGELYFGTLFYCFCIGEKREITNIYEYFKKTGLFTCVFQKELPYDDYSCEIMPKKATKGNAILTLKEKLGFDKIISFGDAVNDISMFTISDESYAVENASDVLKKHATGVIMSNDKDGVVHWLKDNYRHLHVF